MQALRMIASSFLFASMGVCVKFASEHFNSAELVFYRGALGVLFMGAYARATGRAAGHADSRHARLAQRGRRGRLTLNYLSSVWIAFLVDLQYSGIVFSAFYGMALFGDRIPLIGWLGMALIVVSAIAATVLRTRAAPLAPAEEH